MKKIIVPLDFSEYSEFALKAAAKLAKKFDSEIIAVHMLEMVDVMLTSSEGFIDERTVYFFKLAEQRFEDFLKKDYLADIKVTPVIKHFKVFKELNDIVKQQDADLIVMGSQGTSGVADVFVGSNTERVVRHSDVPVLVLKRELKDASFKTALFACDFSEDTIRPYLNAVKMTDKLGAKLHLVHVNLPNNSFKSSTEIEKKVVNFFSMADRNLDRMPDVHYISDYSVEEGVLNLSDKIGADVLLIPTHGRKGLSHFFEGSIGEDIANHADVPVMTFKI
jgi:nucleotide-binding universal stress UspA family protein